MSVSTATIRWQGDVEGQLVLLDQTRLPGEVVELSCQTVEEVWHAIRRLAVRGAPAIGIAAAYGVCLALRQSTDQANVPPEEQAAGSMATAGSPVLSSPAALTGDPVDRVRKACEHLASSRPTAVNLFWALDRMRVVAETAPADQLAARLLAEARTIHEEDRRMCAAIGRHGADALDSIPAGSGFVTHCNSGALATGGDGTALAILFELARRGKRPHVWVDETRPLLQGARLTAWELQQREIEATLICDSMAAQVMSEQQVQAVVTGADRIAANGDVANKIGTRGLAILASHFRIPFYVAAPTSTFDLAIESGAEIPLEVRGGEEITHGFGTQTAPPGIEVYNPAFDVTPAALIAGIITETGIIGPDKTTIASTVTERQSHALSD